LSETQEEGEQSKIKRDNSGYWHGRCEYVKEWRMKNPDYQRRWRQRRKAEKGYLSSGEIQAEIFRKALDCIEKKLVLLSKIQAEIIIIPSVKFMVYNKKLWEFHL
jgi:hypothetical protein